MRQNHLRIHFHDRPDDMGECPNAKWACGPAGTEDDSGASLSNSFDVFRVMSVPKVRFDVEGDFDALRSSPAL